MSDICKNVSIFEGTIFFVDMKRFAKIVALICLLLCCATSRFAASAAPGLRTEWGFTAGIKHPFAKFHMGDSTADLSSKTGFTLGFHMALRIGGMFAVQPEIEFSHLKINISDPAMNFASAVKCNTLQIPILASVKLGVFRINAGPVFTVMDDPSYADRNGEKVMFGRIYPTISYTIGVSVLVVKHLYIDARFSGQFNSTDNFLSYDAAMPGVDFQMNMRSIQLKVGYIF